MYKPAFGHEIVISPEASTVKVTTQAGIKVDSSSNLSINQLSQSEFEYGYEDLNLGHIESTIWIKLNIKNLLNDPNLILNINNPTLDKITLFRFQEGRWIKTELGDLREFHQRLINLPTFAIPIVIPNEMSELIYIRVQSIDTLSIPITLLSQNDFSHYLFTHYTTFGVLYGIPIGLLLYNLLIFISIRKRTLLLYCLVIVSNTFVSLSWDGIAYSLFPDSPYFQQRSISLAMCCGIITLILFAKSFLQTKDKTPQVNMYLNFVGLSAITLALLIFLPNTNIFYIPIIILAILMAPGLLAAGIIRTKQQYTPAKIYLLAISSFLVAVIICALSVLGVLPLQEEITYIYKVGVASELILLSLGIVARMKALKLSEQAAIEQVRKIEKEKLESENLALSKANSLKDTFLSTISHELRTPMNGVKGALTLLNIEKNNPERNLLIDSISQSSDTMIQLIERLLLFTELKAGRINNTTCAFSLHELIESESAYWHNLCEEKSIQFNLDINIKNDIQANKEHIKWILSEVVENAIKFSNKGKILVSAKLIDSDSLVMTVCDQGKGITKGLNNELTELFHQENQEFSREQGGLGLGLSITSELIRLLNGTLSIKTDSEFSTCIKIELPLKNNASIKRTQADIKPCITQFPLNVLIVEDNKINQMVLKKTVKTLGHNTHTANDGAEGYQAAKNYPFDLILMDCQMPSIDGFECTNLIRNTDNINRDTLIVAITANASEIDKERCLSSGMNDYRKKPIEYNTIKKLLDKYFVQAN